MTRAQRIGESLVARWTREFEKAGNPEGYTTGMEWYHFVAEKVGTLWLLYREALDECGCAHDFKDMQRNMRVGYAVSEPADDADDSPCPASLKTVLRKIS